MLGGLIGGVAGVQLGRVLAARKQPLNTLFASLVIAVGVYVVAQGLFALTGSA